MLNTEFEIQTFRKLLDVNWEVSQLEEKIDALKTEMTELESNLVNSMGEDNWNKFIKMGKEMLAEKKEVKP